MSFFAKHINATRSAGRMAVSLRGEEGAEVDPLDGAVGDDVPATEEAPVVDEPAGDDQFAEQRARLNRQHGMIRNRMRAEAEEVAAEEPAVEETVVDEVPVEAPAEDVVVEDAPVVDEVPAVEEEVAQVLAEAAEEAAEDVVVDEPAAEEVPVDAPAEEIVDTPVVEEPVADVVADEVVDVPAEDTVVEEPAVDAPIVEEPIIVDEPAVDGPVVEEPIVDAPVVEEPVVEAPVEAPVEEPAAEEVVEEPALDVTAEGDFSDRPVGGNIGEDVSEPDTNTLPEVDGDKVVDISDSNDVEFDSEEEAAEEEEVAADEAAEDEDLDSIEGDAIEIEALQSEMSMLSNSMVAIESFGINPTAMAIMQTTGLLNGTALESLGLESIGFESPRAPESEMALEALGEKIKEKAAQWSAKIMSVASSVSGKLLGALNSLWTKITGAVKGLTAAAWDKTKTAGKVIKAHPYKTIAAVIVAIAAAAGVVAFVGTGLPAASAKPQALASFAKSLVDKINKVQWPFGKMKAEVVQNAPRLTYAPASTALVPVGQSFDKLGWTATIVKAVGSQMDRAWTGLKTGIGAFGARATKVASGTGSFAKGVGDTFAANGIGHAEGQISDFKAKIEAGKGLGRTIAEQSVGNWAYFGYITACTIASYKFLKWVVVGGFRAIFATLRALGRAVGISSAEPAAA